MFNRMVLFPQAVLTALLTVLGLVLADFALGVTVAIIQKQFDVRKLPDFIRTGVLPYVVPLIVLAAMAGSNASLQAVFFTSAAALTAKFIADIKDKLVSLFGSSAVGITSSATAAPPAADIPASVRTAPASDAKAANPPPASK